MVVAEACGAVLALSCTATAAATRHGTAVRTRGPVARAPCSRRERDDGKQHHHDDDAAALAYVVVVVVSAHTKGQTGQGEKTKKKRAREDNQGARTVD